MNRRMIALDIGTTHIKAALFEEDGHLVQIEKSGTPLENIPGGAYYRPEKIWEIVSGQIECLLKNREKPVRGICATGMAEAGLILKKNTGEPLTAIMSWFDHRTKALSDQMNEEEETALFQKTGLRNSFKYGIYKYLWMLREQQIKSEETIWLSICDYVAYRLTGCYVTDPTFAARTYVYDIRKGCFDEERIRELGLSIDNFPEVKESGKIVGYYQHIPVAIGGHDHICAAYGILYGHEDEICDSAGTSETYVGRIKNADAEFDKESGLLYGPFVDQGYFFMANVPSSGHSVEWFRRKLQWKELTYTQMKEGLLMMPGGPGKILYFPYLTGMGAPWYLPEMKGMLLGLDEESSGPDVLKGILEGIQYQGKWLLKRIEKYHTIRISSLICVGGSTQNDTMMQIKADVLGARVFVPLVAEATLCGAAGLFLKKNGEAAEAETFLKQVFQIEKEYNADQENSRAYERVFQKQYLPFIEYMKTTSAFGKTNEGSRNEYAKEIRHE